jgi:hypothetical protein
MGGASLVKLSDLEVHPFCGSGLSSTFFADDPSLPFSEPPPWGGSSGAHLGSDGPAEEGWDRPAAGVYGLRSPDHQELALGQVEIACSPGGVDISGPV